MIIIIIIKMVYTILSLTKKVYMTNCLNMIQHNILHRKRSTFEKTRKVYTILIGNN